MSFSRYPEKFELDIARGLVKGTSSLHKFGAVQALSGSATGTIWDKDDTVYPWATFASASAVTIPTVNANDNGKEITVQGLDDNYNFAEDTITVSSSGASTGTTLFKRVNRAFVSTGETNTNDINIQISATDVAIISAGLGQTLMAVYTVPANTNMYMTKLVLSADADASVFLYASFAGGAFRIQHTGELATGVYEYEFDVPLKFPAQTDLDVRATAGTNNARITAAFDGILIKEGLV